MITKSELLERSELILNRIFLIDIDRTDIVDEIHAALSWAGQDGYNSLVLCRTLCEKLLVELYENSLDSKPGSPIIGPMMNNRVFTEIFPPNIISSIHYVRAQGNIGAHRKELSSTVLEWVALKTIDEVIDIVHFYSKYFNIYSKQDDKPFGREFSFKKIWNDFELKEVRKLMMSNQWKKALEGYDKLVEKDTENVFMQSERLFPLLEIGRLNTVKKEAENLLELHKDNYRALYALGRYFDLNNDHDKAIRYFERSYSLHKEDEYVIFRYGSLLMRIKQYSRAITFFRRALDLEANRKETYTNLAECLFSNNKRGKESLVVIDRYIEVWGKEEDVLKLRIKILMSMWKYQEALEDLNYISKNIKQTANVYELMYTCQIRSNNYKGAIVSIAEAIKLDRMNLDFYKKRYQAAMNVSLHKIALNDIRLIAGKIPMDYSMFLDRIKCLYELGDISSGLELSKRAAVVKVLGSAKCLFFEYAFYRKSNNKDECDEVVRKLKKFDGNDERLNNAREALEVIKVYELFDLSKFEECLEILDGYSRKNIPELSDQKLIKITSLWRLRKGAACLKLIDKISEYSSVFKDAVYIRALILAAYSSQDPGLDGEDNFSFRVLNTWMQLQKEKDNFINHQEFEAAELVKLKQLELVKHVRPIITRLIDDLEKVLVSPEDIKLKNKALPKIRKDYSLSLKAVG